VSKTEEIYHSLRLKIAEGTQYFSSERHLCEEYQVSQTVIRAALLRLKNEGSVMIQPQGKITVCQKKETIVRLQTVLQDLQHNYPTLVLSDDKSTLPFSFPFSIFLEQAPVLLSRTASYTIWRPVEDANNDTTVGDLTIDRIGTFLLVHKEHPIKLYRFLFYNRNQQIVDQVSLPPVAERIAERMLLDYLQKLRRTKDTAVVSIELVETKERLHV